MNYVLDACAVLAFLNKEREGPRVIHLFNEAITRGAGAVSISMSIVNLVEVYYGMIQKKGNIPEADRIMGEAYCLPFHTIDTISTAVYREASRLKSFYSISLADAFACATAMSLDATLVTKDHEIEAIEQAENLSVFWIDKNLHSSS
jgi:PIN domain nuclease of toxin-antitoxin system